MSRQANTQAAFIGIGSNLGNPIEQVKQALGRLAQLPDTTLEQHSSLFRTAPVDAVGDDFINAVAMLQTRLSAHELLRALQQIEADCGRERPFANAPRTLDLDILLYGNQIIADAELIVPHPRLTQRAFTLIPLLQIDPFISIPGLGTAHTFVPNVSGQVINKLVE